MPNVLDDQTWKRLEPLLKERCPRLTAADLADAGHRVDLLLGKIQYRHWVDRQTAARLLAELLHGTGVA